ncbi:hypothetical protein ASPBRDRAFT_263307 [Aspergillus brasiliensis CBS 101740]|uniref:Uncharacterized protein n=1 Tax=Aspergillus brasiliensis (strain CBS 101740 / IMI 381727 / IBT 21946) TaxID=767769 RepID=A0A1L9V2U8_ASPBC|nr:hypothetical protein ASPBRDRAFT_263307 [Aspergillus brasiliensis CBS 101740]
MKVSVEWRASAPIGAWGQSLKVPRLCSFLAGPDRDHILIHRPQTLDLTLVDRRRLPFSRRDDCWSYGLIILLIFSYAERSNEVTFRDNCRRTAGLCLQYYIYSLLLTDDRIMDSDTPSQTDSS